MGDKLLFLSLQKLMARDVSNCIGNPKLPLSQSIDIFINFQKSFTNDRDQTCTIHSLNMSEDSTKNDCLYFASFNKTLYNPQAPKYTPFATYIFNIALNHYSISRNKSMAYSI